MLNEILKAMLVGLLAAGPIGPVGIFALQRTLSKGRWSGFFSAFGGTLGDMFFSSISIFGLSFFASFIETNATWIEIIGGIVIVIFGFIAMRTDPTARKHQAKVSRISHLGDMGQCFLMTIVNPGALLLVVGFISIVGLNIDFTGRHYMMLLDVIGIMCGSVAWWLFVTWLISKFGSRFKMNYVVTASRAAGVVISILGVIAFVKGILSI